MNNTELFDPESHRSYLDCLIDKMFSNIENERARTGRKKSKQIKLFSILKITPDKDQIIGEHNYCKKRPNIGK